MSNRGDPLRTHTSFNHARALVLVVALASLFLLPAAARASTRVAPGDELVNQIDRYRVTTWRWQRVMGEQLFRSSLTYRTDPSRRYKRWVRDLWQHRAVSARRRALHPPYYSAWLCIHRYEASWTDGGAPYYGGLQMDVGFQLRYGRALYARKGTADHWTPLEQIWTAEKARRSGRGFWPWPNTARVCGVL